MIVIESLKREKRSHELTEWISEFKLSRDLYATCRVDEIPSAHSVIKKGISLCEQRYTLSGDLFWQMQAQNLQAALDRNVLYMDVLKTIGEHNEQSEAVYL